MNGRHRALNFSNVYGIKNDLKYSNIRWANYKRLKGRK